MSIATPRHVIRLALVALVSLTLLGLSACNTVKGVGEDISSAGNAGQRAIDNAGK